MADDDAKPEGEGGEQPAPKSRKMLFIIIGAVLVLALGGGGAFMFMGGAKQEAHDDKPKPPATVFIDLPQMVVNLSTPAERQQYLRIKVALEVKDAELAKQIEPLMPRVVDSFQVQLREMRPTDFEGAASLYRLKEELLRRINAAIAPAHVEAVLFKELILQ